MAVLHGVERPGQVRRDAPAGDVVQLVRVGGGVVVLLLAVVVLHVQRARGADRLVAGRIPLLLALPVRVRRAVIRAVMLDQDGLPPAAGVLPVPQGGQAVPVDRGREGQAGQRLERGAQIDVRGELGNRLPGRDAGTGEDQRNTDVGLERGLLAGIEPVLAHVEAIVGAEDEVRVAGYALGLELGFQVTDHVVDGEVGLDPLAVVRGDGGLLPGGKRRAILQPR